MNPARAARIVDVARCLRQRTGNMRFGSAGRMVEADYDLWATLVVRDGWSVTWACEWISEGYPEPPAWLWTWNGKPATS